MATHTPGPWEVDDDGKQLCIRPAGTGWLLAYVFRDSFAAQSNADWSIEANARLIAAAPELLAALKATVANHCPNDKMFCGSCSPARAVIAKAEGRA